MHQGHTSGIAHTRWATHGAKTDRNAHPHQDSKNRVALVHNGVIQNSQELKQELVKTGIEFRSETDTEVIAQLIGFYMDKGMSSLEAAKQTQKRLHGTWGVVILAKDMPGKIIAMKNGSPLLIGLGDKRKFVGSEPGAFARHTRQYIALQDMEIAVVSATDQLDLSRVETHPEDNIPLSPDPWPHWTIKEIMEQPVAISLALNYGGRILDDMRVKLGGLEDHKAALTQIQNLVVDAAEVSIDTLPKIASGLALISQSGETKDVHRAALLAKELNVPCFSVVNVVGSLIARTTGCGLYLNAGREFAVASTKAFTSTVCCLALAANWFSQNRQGPGRDAKQRDLIDSLHRLPTNIGMALSTRGKMREIAAKMRDTRSMFVLGKGFAEPVAREGALKIKEITYIHAEGYAGGALKHGPFALIEKGTPIILIILDDSQAVFMDIAAAEVKTRGAYTIVITNNSKIVGQGHADEIVEIPTNGVLTALLAAVPIQILAYEISVLRGINPDRPRNLAKAVTVD
eukprot:m51a1_g10576 putative glutamine-fructose-6-phosphate transaminase (516) ;mRNA; f:100-2332